MATFELRNGIKIPSMSLGTFLMKPADAQKAVDNAFKFRYRLIDTASVNVNEKTNIFN